tara:strand:- start:72 stop:485 length:414 start_codon:yes stop_codon:yes gene_type:complete
MYREFIMNANDFLQSYMAKNFGADGDGTLLAAKVLVPVIGDDNKFGMNDRVEMDVPGVASDATVSPIGLFGDPLAPDHPAAKHGFTHQGESNPQRGVMNFVPGGIPAPAGYNMDASREKYPTYFDGVNPGNVPAFIR